VLVAIFVHFFGKARVAAANVQDLEGRLDILGDDILDACVALVPIKWFLIPIKFLIKSKLLLTSDNGLPNIRACHTEPFLNYLNLSIIDFFLR